MKVSNFIIAGLIISFLTLLCIRTKNTIEGGSFSLEVTIEGLDNDKEAFWSLGFIDPEEGLSFMNFETGKLSQELYSKLDFEGEKILINGTIERPRLCRLIDLKNNLQLVFVLGVGEQKIKTSIEHIKLQRYSFELAPFKYEGCKLNEELFSFWGSVSGRNFSNAFNKFNNWKAEQILKLYGITSEEYAVFELIKKRSSLSKLLKVSKEEEDVYHKLEAEKLHSLEELKWNLTLNYLRKNPNSYLALEYTVAYLHVLRNCQIDYDYMNRYMSLIGEELSDEDIYKKLKHEYNQKKRMRIASHAPDLCGYEINGNKLNLSDLLGNYVLVEFMDSQCDFCKDEQTNLLDLYIKYMDHDFTILSVSFDKSKDDWLSYLKDHEKPWIQIRDSLGIESTTIEKYSCSGFPFYVLIDKDGRICTKSLVSPGKGVNDENNLNLQLENIYKF
jgi:glutathione peroxidase-family protein